jgi:hypothetical protein
MQIAQFHRRLFADSQFHGRVLSSMEPGIFQPVDLGLTLRRQQAYAVPDGHHRHPAARRPIDR